MLRLNKKIRIKNIKNIFIVIFSLFIAVFIALGAYNAKKADAAIYFYCGGTCTNCEPSAASGYHYSSSNTGSCVYGCCFDSACNGNCAVQYTNPGCGNCGWYCPNSGGPVTPTPTGATGTGTPSYYTCNSCNSYNNCGSDVPGSKFRRKPVTYNGSWQTCNNNGQTCPVAGQSCDCPSTSGSCQWTVYYNSPPTCSIQFLNGNTGYRRRPSNTDLPLNDVSTGIPLQIRLTTTDKDEGDTVEVTGYTVSNYCATVRTNPGGQEPFGVVVKPGAREGQNVTTGLVNFELNQNNAHGSYPNGICQGKITFELRDLIGESGDTQDVATCSANFTIYNDTPQFLGAELYDRDPDTSVRAGGNLLNGQNQIVVASQDVTARPAHCTNAVDINNPVLTGQYGDKYPDCNPKTNLKSRTNSFEFSYTVKDGNGSDDILHGGIWIQNKNFINGAATSPKASVVDSSRHSIAAMYDDMKYRDINYTGQTHYVTRAPFTTPLAATENLTESSYHLSGLRMLYRSDLNGGQGYRFSLFQQWQAVGFPDCLDNAVKCGPSGSNPNNNIAVNSRTQSTENTTNLADTIWDKTDAAAPGQYICYAPQTSLSEVTIKPTCDGTCAACIRRNPTKPIERVDNKTYKFNYEIQINNSLPEGDYGIFVDSIDKVGTTINAGPEWTLIQKNGQLCTNNTCGTAAANLIIDKTPPTYSIQYTEGVGNILEAQVSQPADPGGASASGVATNGLYSIIFYREFLAADGVTKTRQFLRTSAGGCEYNGSSICYTGPITNAGGFKFSAYGAEAKDTIRAIVCIYDKAGNGTCRDDGISTGGYLVQAAWLKTSLGSVYSNTAANSNAFSIFLPVNPPNTDATATNLLYPPFSTSNTQPNTLVGMVYGSGSNNSGVTGGVVRSGSQLQGGINGFYRLLDSSDVQNRPAYTDSSAQIAGAGGWYNRLYSIVQYNCSLLSGANGCTIQNVSLTSATANALGPILSTTAAKNKITFVTVQDGTNGPVTMNTDLWCTNNNILFFKGSNSTVIFNHQLRKDPANGGITGGLNNCLFVFDSSVTFRIQDTPDNEALADVDQFQGAIVTDGPFFDDFPGKDGKGANGKFDMLQLYGFIYSTKITPELKRDLVFSENKKLPSEWIIYDADVLESLRLFIGERKYSDLKCGASGHPVCNQ